MPENVEETQEMKKDSSAAQVIATSVENQYLTFHMQDELFGVSILRVREIIEYGRITKVPMTPSYVRGVINLRGQVVPVVDLADYFHIGNANITEVSCVVVMEIHTEHDDGTIGILVDSVDEVRGIAESAIEAAPGLGAKVDPEFLEGVGKTGQKFILLLDVDRALDIKKLALFNDTQKETQTEKRRTQS